jgi:predicted TPR repeat methyltransferase
MIMFTWLDNLAHQIRRPRGERTIKRRGDEHLKHDELEDAARCYRQAISLDPDYVDARIGLGFVLMEQKQYIEAEGNLDRALAIDPTIADAHYLLGRAYKEQGDLERSIASFTSALRCKPDFEFAYRDLYLVLYQRGEFDRAKHLLNNAISFFPESAEFQFYLGNLLSGENSFASAIVHYETALSLRPDAAETHNMLGDAVRKSGNLERALTCYRNATTLRPDLIEPYINIGIVLQQQGKIQDAITSYKQAVALRPEHAAAHHYLGNAYLEIGAAEWAIACFQDVVKLEPAHGVQHLLDAFSGRNSEHAPAQYVENLFDTYADTFDSHLVQGLQYSIPEQLVGLLKRYAAGGLTQWDVLDLGCGTGLVGFAIGSLARKIVGVDLSAKMLSKAKERHLYHRLEHVELLAMAEAEATSSYDLVTAADVLIYVGRLDPLFNQVHRLLRPNGLLVFSVDSLDPSTQHSVGADSECKLTQTGRYAHSAAYVRRLAAENEFDVLDLVDARGRMEHGKPVQQQLVVLRRRDNQNAPREVVN